MSCYFHGLTTASSRKRNFLIMEYRRVADKKSVMNEGLHKTRKNNFANLRVLYTVNI